MEHRARRVDARRDTPFRRRRHRRPFRQRARAFPSSEARGAIRDGWLNPSPGGAAVARERLERRRVGTPREISACRVSSRTRSSARPRAYQRARGGVPLAWLVRGSLLFAHTRQHDPPGMALTRHSRDATDPRLLSRRDFFTSGGFFPAKSVPIRGQRETEGQHPRVRATRCPSCVMSFARPRVPTRVVVIRCRASALAPARRVARCRRRSIVRVGFASFSARSRVFSGCSSACRAGGASLARTATPRVGAPTSTSTATPTTTTTRARRTRASPASPPRSAPRRPTACATSSAPSTRTSPPSATSSATGARPPP